MTFGSESEAEQSRPRVAVFSAFKYRNYRVFWTGFFFSIIGYQIQTVAQAWLVYDLTGSALDLGLVSGAQAVASLMFSLLGGVIADRIDRRRFLLAIQCCMTACSLILATLTATDVIEVWQIAVIAFCFGSLSAFEQPSRASFVPNLVERKDLTNAVALTSVVWQGSRIIGPTIAGILIGFFGAAPCFYITAAGFLAVLAATYMVRVPVVAEMPRRERENVARALVSGVRYVRGNALIASLIGLSFFNSLFGTPYQTLMPVFAREELDVGPQWLGVLFAASGIGALVGTFTVAGLGDTARKGLLIFIGSIGFGFLLIVFALSQWVWLSIAVLVGMGAFASLYLTSVNTTLQMSVEDQYRGRVMGIYALSYSLTPLGGLQAGAIAEVTDAPTAVIFGAIMVIAFAIVVALTNSSLRGRPGVPRPAPSG